MNLLNKSQLSEGFVAHSWPDGETYEAETWVTIPTFHGDCYRIGDFDLRGHLEVIRGQKQPKTL